MDALNCRDVITEFLADYVDGTLQPDITRELEKHLRLCPACVAYLNTYRKARELVGQQASQAAMPEEMKAILRRVMRERMAEEAP